MSVKYKQVGQNLIISVKEKGSAETKYSLKVADKEEREALVNKIKGYVKKVNNSGSELVVTKNTKTLVNLFTKEKKKKEDLIKSEKAINKSISRNKSDKKTVKSVKAKTNKLTKLASDINKLSEEDKQQLLAQLGEGKKEVAKDSKKPQLPARTGRRFAGEH
jgi:hypothetical protein